MLIIAIPKSCSTSLMTTLGDLHGLLAKQLSFSPDVSHKDYPILSKLHYDQSELTPVLVDQFMAPDHIYKQHVVPTAHNLSLLKDRKKVVLLRDPLEIVLSYRRWLMTGLSSPKLKHHVNLMQLFGDDLSEDAWLRLAERNGLLEELRRFHNTWAEQKDEKLLLQYCDLVANPKSVVNQIEDYFSLSLSNRVQLAKQRYTRSRVRNLIFRLGRKEWVKRLELIPGIRRVKSSIIDKGRPS